MMLPLDDTLRAGIVVSLIILGVMTMVGFVFGILVGLALG